MGLFDFFFKTFTVNPKSLSLKVGDSAMLNVNAAASFASLDPAVATVEASGLVLAKSVGVATISALERATGVERLVQVSVGFPTVVVVGTASPTTTPLTLEQRISNLEGKAHTH